MSTESEQKFKAALAKRNQDKADEAARKQNGGGTGYTDVPFTALGTSDRVYRIRGLPYSVREKGTDVKKIWFTLALKDDDKYTRIIGPDPRSDEGKAWLLYRVINTVLSYDWNPDLNGGKGGKVYKFQDSCPDIFNRVAKNNQLTNKHATGWQFHVAVLFNVIDRQNMDWHRTEKKLRVLSKGCWEGQDKKMNFDLGVPDGVYTSIMDDIVCLDGNTNWEDYDVVLKKLTENPWYRAYHPKDDIKRISDEALKIASMAPLTEEEKSWQMWDFDKLYSITRYKKIQEAFGLTIQKVDKVFGKTFYEELQRLVEEEEKQITAQRAAQAAEGKTEEDNTASDEPAPEEAPGQSASVEAAPARQRAPAAEAAPASSTLPWDKLIDGSYNGYEYKGVELLTDQEKSWIFGVNPDKTLKFDPAAGEPLQDMQTKELVPERLHCNPYSGREYQ